MIAYIKQNLIVIIQLFLKNIAFIRKQYKMERLSYQWGLMNKHNMTRISNPLWQELFPLNKVKVGRYTYGDLHVVPYNKNDGYLEIGSFCSIARNVQFLLGGNHDYLCISTYPFKLIADCDGSSYSKGNIIIEDDVWICENVTILSGVKISQGAVVAANTLVSRDVLPYEIVGGNPMKHIKYRFDEKIRKELLRINFDNIDLEFFNNNKELFKQHIDDDNITNIVSCLCSY